MKKLTVSLILLVSFCLVPESTKAQVAQVLKEGNITTAGATCVVNDTNCIIVISLIDVPSVGLFVDIGTSGTINFEYSLNDPTEVAPVWRAMPDDLTSATSTTADGAFFFSNPGYRMVRARASAISGPTSIKFIRGYASFKTTATLTGSGGDGAILDGVSAAIKASVMNYTNAKPLAIVPMDNTGTYAPFGGAITSFPANQPFNLAQIAGTATAVGNGASSAGTTRVIEANDSALALGIGGTADATVNAGATGSISAKLRRITTQLDNQSCSDISQVQSVIISGTVDAQLVAVSGTTVIYVCGFNVTSAGDVNARLISGTGSVCATGTTARTGNYQLIASSGSGIRGISMGFGNGPVTKTAAGEALCVDVSAAVQVDGVLTYVQK